jgi:hypothetical protein
MLTRSFSTKVIDSNFGEKAKVLTISHEYFNVSLLKYQTEMLSNVVAQTTHSLIDLHLQRNFSFRFAALSRMLPAPHYQSILILSDNL